MASPIEDIIEEIEEYIDTCKPVAFSSSKISVNRDDIQALIDELRRKTPEEIRRYQKIISNEKAIIANAEKQAANIVAEAQIKTDKLVNEHQIMQVAYDQANEVIMVATQKAQELLDKATIEANDLRARAITYTDDLLKTVQEIIVRSMDSTRTKADTYLAEMQSYLDVVVSNRMELSPSPEETILNAPQPKAATTNMQQKEPAKQQDTPKAAQAAQNASARKGQAPAKSEAANSAGSKDNNANAKSGVRNISDRFFNKD